MEELAGVVIEGVIVPEEVIQADFVPDTQPVLIAKEDTFIVSGLSPDELRAKISSIYHEVIEINFLLCRFLLEVKVKELYKSWNYSTFKEYVQKELQIQYSKANTLANIWFHFGKNPELQDKLRTVKSWDKIGELIHVVNPENVDYWVSKANMISADDLRKEVKIYLKSLVSDNPSDALKNESQVTDTVVADQVKSITYHFSYENYIQVCTAIEKVQQDNPGVNPPEAMALICAEFLGSQSDGTGVQGALSAIKQFEIFQPIECLVVERDSDHVVYGTKLFNRLIGSAFGNTNA